MTYLRKEAIIGISASFWLLRICFIRHVLSRHLTERKVYCCFEKIRDREHFSYLAQQVLPHDSKGLSDAYRNATEKPHGYLVLDLSQITNDRLRFRTCIFPEEEPPIFYVDLGNETCKKNFHTIHVLKNARPKLRKAIRSNCDRDLVNCISECVLNILHANVALTGCA